ncbi:hypothetical protein RN001_015768 [Aquatica leii]|uniref:Nuclear pore complex protein Nup98-Nup96 n=1 Tax=Aquatica leii TaxID=1421715 RepID=A0AAN7NX84_9COLE|nr:hypothetical protein RN001_015768 [Aquatica leii]
MFSNLNKPAFGTSTSTPAFGFGNTSTTNQTPFGQTQFFGKSNTAGFGQTAPLFGSTAPQNTGTLFSNTALPTFGGTSQQTGFGTGLFGQQQNVGVSSGTNGLFTSSSTSTFGQQNKTPSFGFGASTSTLFGQQQTQNFQPSTSGAVFGASSGFGGTAQMGTVIKFNPATGTDTMQKSGVTHSINTKHHCITCMKEYEGKSLEELRWEDYQANRKGPQTGFGATPFGAPASTAPSLFGQTDNKTAFGQTTTFGSPATSGFNISNQATQPSLFGKPNTGFGTTPTTNSFSFNTAPSAFGTSNIGKPFGNQPTQSVFGATATTQAPSGFGNNLFPNATQNAGGLFGKTTTQSVFSNQQPVFAFNQPSTSQPSFFQTSKPATGFGSFGSTNLTTTPAFGQPTNLFSTPATQNPFNAIQKPAQPTFQTGFGLGAQSNTNTFYGANKSLFGGSTQGNFFNTPSSGFMMNQQQAPLNQSVGFDAQPNQDFHTHVEQIYDPFPHYDFLLDALKGKTHNTTDPKALKEILDQAPMPVTSIEKNISKYRTLIKPRNTSLSYPGCKYALLDDVVDKTTSSNNLSFKSGKRLVLRKNITRSDRDMMEEYKRMVDSEDSNKNKSLFRNLQQLDNEKCDVLEQTKSITPNSSFQDVTNSGLVFHTKLNDNFSFEETPVRDKFDKPNVKQILLNTSTENDSELSIDINPRNSVKSILHTEDGSPYAKTNKTVRFQDNEFSMSKEECMSSCGVSPIEESNNNSESEGENTADDNVKVSTALTCGVKLTNPECYTKPPLNQLHKYKNDKGECIVKGFTIGRTGYGCVYFPDAIDVANLDLDDIVHFRFREITVYPNDDKKPPVGQGLNRRAQVTLEHVWPRDRNTHEIIRDVQEISKTNFIDRLCLLAERQNATFLDYHPESGSWLFTVNHFSKYKFTDSSDEECERFLHRSKSMLEKKIKRFENEVDFERMGLGGVIMEKELNSTAAYTIFSDQPQMPYRKDPSKPVFIIKSSFFDEESISDDESSDVGIPIPLQVTSLDTSLSSENEQLRWKDGIIKNYSLLSKTGDCVQNLSSFFHDSYVDSACFKGRAFKVRWSRGYNLITRESIQIPSGNLYKRPEDSLINRIQIVDVTKEIVGNDKFIWEDYLKAVFEISSLDVDEQLRLPTFSITSTLELLNKYCEVSTKWKEIDKTKDLKYYSQIWDLCRILWGSSTSAADKRQLFSTWLHSDLPSFNINSEVVHPKDVTILTLLEYYFSNDISSASKFATEKRFPALSLLLTQKQESTMRHLVVQHEQWQHNGTLDVMDEHISRMYKLLGGVEVIRGSDVFRNLEWKQILATYLCHFCSKNTKLEDVVAEYTKAFTVEKTANFPLNQTSELALDLQYRLLELYSNLSTDLSKILNPYGYTKHIGDFHLSWFLLLLFDFHKIGVSNENISNTICMGFAAQLEAVGLWTWAIFALLFIKNKKVKEKAVKSILERNIKFITDEYEEYEEFLTKKLKIPSEIIHSILSYMKDGDPNYFESYQHLALSKDFGKANQQAQLYVIPELIINHKYQDLHYLLEPLADGHLSAGVGVIRDFLQLLNETNEEKINQAQVLHESELISLAKNLKHFPKCTLKQSLTVAELSRHIKMLFVDYCSEKRLVNIESELPIPEDYRFLKQCSTNVIDDFIF